MKPFTFMTVVLGLVLGFLFAAGRQSVVSGPAEPVHVQAYHVHDSAEDAPDPDDEDDREEAEGLPVPIVPGTRVTEAEALPPKAAKAPRPARRAPSILRRGPAAVAATEPSMTRLVSGRLSATVERARADARLQLEREVAEWLTPEVPTNWRPPAPLLVRLIRKTEVHPIVKDYGTVYEATLEADFSTMNRDRLLGAHRREVVTRRLAVLGGSLGFVLACLASLAGYIRADEATKGYYTHWLRGIAAAGVGATGVLIYQFLA